MSKQVIVVRKDLNMRKGKIAAQAAHASQKVFFDRGTLLLNKGKPEMTIKLWPAAEDWIKNSFTKVVVGCESENELLEILKKALDAGIPCSLITDSGRTEFHGVPTRTCIAIGPEEDAVVDRITGHLKLL